MKYYYPKKRMSKDGIQEFIFHFDNGECLSLYSDEIEDVNLNFYDKLEKHRDSFCKVAQEGTIKLNVSLYKGGCWDTRLLINEDEHKKHRRRALIERLLIPGIACINVHYYNGKDATIYGNFIASKNGNKVLLTVVEQPIKGSYNADNFCIDLYEVNKDNVDSIGISLENGERLVIYNDELLDINLKLNDRLYNCYGSILREVIGGNLVIKLNKKKTYRDCNLFNDIDEHTVIKLYEYIYRRLIKNELDIADIYVNYKSRVKEHLVVNPFDERGEKGELINYSYQEDLDDEDYDYYYISSSAEINDEGCIVIKFE